MLKREAELRAKNEELQRMLKTSTVGELRLKTGQGNLTPRDTIFGGIRQTTEGFPIKRSIPLGKGQLEISDYAFENIRIAWHLMIKAQERNRDDEETRYLWDQAERAMNGGRLSVAVAGPEKTTEATKRTEQYKQMAFDVAVDQSRIEYIDTKQKEASKRLTTVKKRKEELAEEIKSMPDGPSQGKAPPAKPKRDLLKDMEALDAEISATAEEVQDLAEQQKSAKSLAISDQAKLDSFLQKYPEIAPRERKKQ